MDSNKNMTPQQAIKIWKEMRKDISYLKLHNEQIHSMVKEISKVLTQALKDGKIKMKELEDNG